MTCSSCVYKVEKNVSKLAGVKDVIVNLEFEKAKVIYDTNFFKE